MFLTLKNSIFFSIKITLRQKHWKKLFKGNVVNRTCTFLIGGSFEIRFTVPLINLPDLQLSILLGLQIYEVQLEALLKYIKENKIYLKKTTKIKMTHSILRNF